MTRAQSQEIKVDVRGLLKGYQIPTQRLAVA